MAVDFFLPWSVLGKMTIIIYSVRNHQKRSVRGTWNVTKTHFLVWEIKKREKFKSFAQHGKEWLQITLRFRNSEDHSKTFVFTLYNCRTCFLIQWQFIAVFTTVSFRLQQFSQNYWQPCKISDKLFGELLMTQTRSK